MFTMHVSYWAAFSAGVLSFFSPCLLPLIPGYIMYLTGTYSNDELRQKRKRALFQTFGFILGFTMVFMLLGLSASALGQLFLRNQQILGRIGGLVIIFFGLMMTGLVSFSPLQKDYRKHKAAPKVTFFSAVGLGMAFAFGWTPCFGPILGAILAYTSAMSQDLSHGVILLFIYSMGMAIPFMATAFFVDFLEQRVSAFSQYSRVLKPIAGGFMIMIGVLILTNRMQLITNFLLENIPVLGGLQ